MSPDTTPPEDNEASRLLRQAILHELQCPPSDPEVPAADNLQQIARSLVNKMAQGDVSAIKEVIERIGGKAVAGASQGMTALSEKDFPPLARCEIQRHVGPRGNCCDRPVGTQRLSTDPATSSARQRLVGG
jgi:hypothetical protein